MCQPQLLMWLPVSQPLMLPHIQCQQVPLAPSQKCIQNLTTYDCSHCPQQVQAPSLVCVIPSLLCVIEQAFPLLSSPAPVSLQSVHNAAADWPFKNVPDAHSCSQSPEAFWFAQDMTMLHPTTLVSPPTGRPAVLWAHQAHSHFRPLHLLFLWSEMLVPSLPSVLYSKVLWMRPSLATLLETPFPSILYSLFPWFISWC